MRVPLMLFSIKRANHVNRRFLWIGKKLEAVFPNLHFELGKADLEINASRYLAASFFSALVYGLVFFMLVYWLFFFREGAITAQNSILSAVVGLAFFAIFFFLHLIYPNIIAKKYAAGIDQSLVFALKSMMIQVSSGISLFDSMVNVSKSKYGLISDEFEDVARDISSGTNEARSLERMALKTKSDYLKRTSWQLVTSLRSGASLAGALKGVVQTLVAQQMRAIKDYAAELNMIILLYLLLAAAIPTLGITFLVVLSAMAGASIGPGHIVAMVVGALIMQVVLIGFVKTRIPKVFA